MIPFVELKLFRKFVRSRDSKRVWINVELGSSPRTLERRRKLFVERTDRSVRYSACVSGVTRLRCARWCRGCWCRSQQQIGRVAHSEELVCAAAPVRMRFQSFFAERCLYVASAGTWCHA